MGGPSWRAVEFPPSLERTLVLSCKVKMIRKVAVCSAFALAGAANAFATDRDSGASASGYGAPAPSYGAPEPSYEEPVQEYAAAPSYGAAEAAVPDLTPIIIGILVLTGLSLLFPTYVTLTSVRRKRSAESTQDENPMNNMIERVQDMYMAVLQSEECMERVACEVGGLAEDAGISKSLTRASEAFLPKKYNKMMKNFNHGKDCSKNNKCGLF